MCLPVVQILTLCPPMIVTIYVSCTHLSLTVTLTQKYVKTHSHPDQNTLIPKNHSFPSGLLTKNHTLSLPKITYSLTPIVHANRAKEDSSSIQMGRKTHSLPSCNALHVTWGNWDLIEHANRAEEDQDYCSSVQPLQVD